jgi:hypothetical protein
MPMLNIRYNFRFSESHQEIIDLEFDPKSLNLKATVPKSLPHWTRLDFNKCPNCTLDQENNPNCPISVHLVRLMEIFDSFKSYDPIDVDITTSQRNISKNTSMQKGLSSLLGLIMATSGCPHMHFFKPMARFHLPFADAEETIYRATSMYLLAQYFLRKEGRQADLELHGLKKIYEDIQVINSAMAKRLFAVSDNDVIVNAIIILDSFAQMLFLVVEDSLEDVRHLFKPYFDSCNKTDH